jgi:nitrite reductase/ring-hydroxylating ferredoxin subunit
MHDEMSRRDCLNWLARATVGIAAADLCGLRAQCAEKGEKREKKDGLVKLADLAALRNESAIEIAKQNLILTRSNAGVTALSIFCTHRHNRLEIEKDGSIVCPVHDSIFDFSGKPQSGPASRALTAYLTQIDDDGAIRVDTSKTVKSGTFAELPAWAKPKK